MFRRIFGKNSSKGKKKRLSPTNGTAQGLASGSPGPVASDGNSVHASVAGAGNHPGYQYALNEFAQTVAPTYGNDDGRFMLRQNSKLTKTGGDPGGQMHPVTPSADQGAQHPQQHPQQHHPQHHPQDHAHHGGQSPSNATHMSSTSTAGLSAHSNVHAVPSVAFSSDTADGLQTPSAGTAYSNMKNHEYHQHISHIPFSYKARQDLPETHSMTDATYEEWYGDAYLGGPVKYIYPTGYQSMRPRGVPWKLSMVVCLIFTWLSIFVIGHCADRVDQSLYNQMEIDDDTLVIETRWCGSHMLYMLWVISMLITGLAASYCGVVGYIKVRDFAVANTRSQPPGYVGKSDYYVQLQDNFMEGGIGGPTGSVTAISDPRYYEKTIYQADGNPQFWGNHIYRPTQAAVAITSR